MRASTGKSRYLALMLALVAGSAIVGGWWLLDGRPVGEQSTTTSSGSAGVVVDLGEAAAAPTVATPTPISPPPIEADTPRAGAANASLYPAFRALPKDGSLSLLVLGKVTDETAAPIEGAAPGQAFAASAAPLSPGVRLMISRPRLFTFAHLSG